MLKYIPWATWAHFVTWFLLILVPYSILIIGFVVLKTHRDQHRFEKVFDIGWDSCILGIGIAAALLGGSEFQTILPNAAVIPMGLGGFTMMLLYVSDRSKKQKRVTKARWSVLAATLGCGINTALVTWLNERQTYATVFWGIMAFIATCGVSYVIIARQDYADPEPPKPAE